MATASYTNRLPHLGGQPRDEETLRSAYRQASQALSPIMAVSSPETEEYSVPQTPADDEEDEMIAAVQAGLYQQPTASSWVYPSHNTTRAAPSVGSDSRPLVRQSSSQGGGGMQQQASDVPMSRTISARRRGSCGRAPSLSTILQSPQLDSDKYNDVDEDNISPRSSFSFGRQMGSRNHVRGGSIGASIGQTLAQTAAASTATVPAAPAPPACKMSYEQALERQMSARKLSASSRQQRRSFSTVKTAAAAVFDAPGSTFDNGMTKYKLVQAARSIRLDPSQIDPLAKDGPLSTPTSGSFNSRRTSMSPTDVSGNRMSRRPSAAGSPYGLQCGDVPIRRISCTSPRSTSFAAAAAAGSVGMGNDLDGELMSGSPAAIAHASQGLALTTQSLNDASFYAKEQRVRQVSTSSILSASFMSMKLPASSASSGYGAGRGRRPSELSVDMRRESLAEKFAAQDGLLITSVATVSTQPDGVGMAPRVVDALHAAAKSAVTHSRAHSHGQQGHRHTHSWAPLASRKKSLSTTYLSVPSLSMQAHVVGGGGGVPVKSKPRRRSRQLSFNTMRSISPGRRCSSDLSIAGDSRRSSRAGDANEHRRRRSSSVYAPPVQEIHLDGMSPTSAVTPRRRRSSARTVAKQTSPAGSHWSPDNSDDEHAAGANEGDEEEEEDDELTPTTSSIGHAAGVSAAAAGAAVGSKRERRSSYIPMFLSPELTATSSPPQPDSADAAAGEAGDDCAPRLSLKPTSPLLAGGESDMYDAARLFDDRHSSHDHHAASAEQRSRGTSETSVFSMVVRKGRKMSVCVVETVPESALAAMAGGGADGGSRRRSSVDEAAIAQAAAYATAVAGGNAVDQARAFVQAVSAVELGDDLQLARRASRAERRASRPNIERLPDDRTVQLDDNDDDYEDCTTTDDDELDLDLGLDRGETLSEAEEIDLAHLDEAPCSDSDDEGSVVSVATRAVRMRPALMPSALGGIVGGGCGPGSATRAPPPGRPLLVRNATYSPPSQAHLATSALSPRPVALRASSDKLFATLRLQDELAAAAAAAEVETPQGPRSPDLYNGAPRSPRLNNAPHSPALGGGNGWQSPRFPGAQWSSEPNTPTFAAPRLASSSPRAGVGAGKSTGVGMSGCSSSPTSPRLMQAQISSRQPLTLSTSPGSPGRYMPSSPLATPTSGRRRFLSTSTTASDDDDDAKDRDDNDDAKDSGGADAVKTVLEQAEVDRRRRSKARDLELSQLRALVARLTDRIDKLEAGASASATASAAASSASSPVSI